MTNFNKSTSWQKVHSWYDDLVGCEGHHYHKTVILPGILPLLGLDKESSLLDLACGQGVLSRAIPESVKYCGIDISRDLIKKADLRKLKNQKFCIGDITKKLPLALNELYSHAAIILALQNTEDPKAVFKVLAPHLQNNATLVIVINHPCYRIPRQSNWGEDPNTHSCYRKVSLYMTPQKIPIQMHPGKGADSSTTYSFHHPLSSYTKFLKEAGFFIEEIQEWCSDKVSTGAKAKAENRARKEFPLFMAIKARYNVIASSMQK